MTGQWVYLRSLHSLASLREMLCSIQLLWRFLLAQRYLQSYLRKLCHLAARAENPSPEAVSCVTICHDASGE